MSIQETPVNPKIQDAFYKDLTTRYEQLEKVADKTIKSFADFVSELSKLKQASTGTDIRDPVTKLAGEMNNNTIFLTKMISEQLKSLHGIINPYGLIESGEDSTTTTG